MLDECRASVLAQTFSGWEHLRLLDDARLGCAATMNTLAEQAQGDWLFPLADDDLLLPGCLQTLLENADGGDVVYSPPLVWGVKDPWWFYDEPPKIPAVALINKTLWWQLGGYDHEWNREEDRRLWIRAMEQQARFQRVSVSPTWVYRIHGGNKSFNDGNAA